MWLFFGLCIIFLLNRLKSSPSFDLANNPCVFISSVFGYSFVKTSFLIFFELLICNKTLRYLVLKLKMIDKICCEWTVLLYNKIKSIAIIKQKDVRVVFDENFSEPWLINLFPSIYASSDFKNAEYYIILNTAKTPNIRKLANIFNS